LSLIHSSAIIDPRARIAGNVTVGAFSVIGPEVEIAEGCWIGPHVVINGPTRIGHDNRIFQFASIGDMPQDKKYAGEPTRLEIGDRNVIREYCTINRGTTQDTGVTRVGNDNWIMAYVHIAHDCQIGDHTIFANSASLAGHVHVGNHAILGGFTLVHQFCRIGAHCFTGLSSVITKDVPPFVMAAGNPASPHGLNREGLKRRGFSETTLTHLRRAYKQLYRSGLSFEAAIEQIAAQAGEGPEIAHLVDFLRTSSRGIVR
jgi:UDP-N-acetylglucosamine acyltransferase